MRVHALILAAGESRRLGRNKQLVQLHGQPLLRRCLLHALAVAKDGVTVVTGFEHQKVSALVRDLPCEVLENPQWSQGIGGSLAIGVKSIALKETAEAVLVMLSDQVMITPSHYQNLIDAFAEVSGRSMVATEYNGMIGAPAVFSRAHFAELTSMTGHQGAKALLSKYRSIVFAVENADAAFDLDTLHDLDRLQRYLEERPDLV